MNVLHLFSVTTKPVVLLLAVSAALPVAGRSSGKDARDGDDNEGSRERVMVLYEGPLSHDQDWTITVGPRGPQNQVPHRRGGTCSMVPANLSNISAFERVTFTAIREHLGIWKMSWADTVSGIASDGNKYKYQQRYDFVGVTSDGDMPRPSRDKPVGGIGGFLVAVPGNVATDTLDFDDFFLLFTSSGDIAASSHISAVYRQQIPPASLDPGPLAFPAVAFGRYIINVRNQLAGQAGCDPL